jgi:HK97 family phage prohead protease
MTTARFVWDFELHGKAVEDDRGAVYVSGLASDYLPDRDDELVSRDAMRDGLAKYMASNPIVLFMHKWDRAVGRVVAAHIDDRGLHIEARLDAPTDPSSWQADVVNKVRSGTLRTFSIGGRFHRVGNVIERVDLMEISIATVPINPRAVFSVVAEKAIGDSPATEIDDLARRISWLAQEAQAMRYRNVPSWVIGFSEVRP